MTYNFELGNMYKFALWVLTLLLIQNAIGQRYYYAQIGDQYDIYYGPQPIRGYKEVKSPKSYKIEYGQRADRPGVCYKASFSCGYRKYPISQTIAFECLEDFQCPRYYKCCQSSCFQHKICQAAIISNTTEKTGESNDLVEVFTDINNNVNNRFGADIYWTPNKVEVTTTNPPKTTKIRKKEKISTKKTTVSPKYKTMYKSNLDSLTSTTAFNNEKLFEEWLKQNTDLYLTTYSKANKAMNEDNMFEEWVKQNPDVFSTTPVNVDINKVQETSTVQNTERLFEEWIKKNSQLYLTTSSYDRTTLNKLSTSRKNIDELFEEWLKQNSNIYSTTPFNIDAGTNQQTHKTENPQELFTYVGTTTDKRNKQKVTKAKSTRTKGIVATTPHIKDTTKVPGDKKTTDDIDILINEVFKNLTEGPITTSDSRKSENNFFTNTPTYPQITKIVKEILKTTDDENIFKDVEGSGNYYGNNNKRKTTVQNDFRDSDYMTKNTEKLVEELNKKEEDLFFTDKSDYIPDKKVTKDLEDISTTDKRSKSKETEVTHDYTEQREHTRTTVQTDNFNNDHKANEIYKNHTDKPAAGDKKTKDTDAKEMEEILKTTDDENILDGTEGSGNYYDVKENERRDTDIDYAKNEIFKNVTGKPNEKETIKPSNDSIIDQKSSENVKEILKTTDDENLLDEIEGSGNFNEDTQGTTTTVQFRSTHRDYRVHTTKTSKQKDNSISDKPSKDSEDLFFTNMPGEITDKNFTRNMDEISKTTDDENMLDGLEGSGNYDDHREDKRITSGIYFTDLEYKEKEPSNSYDNTDNEFVFDNDTYRILNYTSEKLSEDFITTESGKHIIIKNVTLEQKEIIEEFALLSTTENDANIELSTKQIPIDSKYQTTTSDLDFYSNPFSTDSNNKELFEKWLSQNTYPYLTTSSNINKATDEQNNSQELFKEWLRQNSNSYSTTPTNVAVNIGTQTNSAHDTKKLFEEWLKENTDFFKTTHTYDSTREHHPVNIRNAKELKEFLWKWLYSKSDFYSTTPLNVDTSQQTTSMKDSQELFKERLNQNSDFYSPTPSNVDVNVRKQTSSAQNTEKLFEEWLKENTDLFITTPSYDTTRDQRPTTRLKTKEFLMKSLKPNSDFHSTTPFNVEASQQTTSLTDFQELFKEWLKHSPDFNEESSRSTIDGTSTHNQEDFKKTFSAWLKENADVFLTTPLNVDMTTTERSSGKEKVEQMTREWSIQNLYLTTISKFDVVPDKYTNNMADVQNYFEEWLKNNSIFYSTTPLKADITANRQSEWSKENQNPYLTTVAIDDGSNFNNQENSVPLKPSLETNSYKNKKENNDEKSSTEETIPKLLVNPELNVFNETELSNSTENTILEKPYSEGEVAACTGEASISKPIKQPNIENNVGEREPSEITNKESPSTNTEDKKWNKQYDETKKNVIKNVQTLEDDEDSIQEASGDSSGDYEVANNKGIMF